VDLARHYDQNPVQIGEISKRQDISVKYLEQLIRPLKQAKLVTSVRGPKGGHLLAKKPEKITLGQIVRLNKRRLPNIAPPRRPLRLKWKPSRRK
jgi:Rrf2 family protein